MSETTALYRHLCKTYEILFERSVEEETGERIFRGNLTDVVKETGASRTYYSYIRRLLLSPSGDPCVTILQRGAGGIGSIVQLHHAPLKAFETISISALTDSRSRATLMPDVLSRVEALEGWRETTKGVNLAEALRNFEKRISNLESQKKGV